MCRLMDTRPVNETSMFVTWSGSGTSGEPTAHRVRGVSAWCSRSVHVVHVVADQEHRQTSMVFTIRQMSHKRELSEL